MESLGTNRMSSLRHYCLVVTRSEEACPVIGTGLILKLMVPEGTEDWKAILPGAHKAGKIQSQYAILGCHHVLSHESKENNTFSLIGSEKKIVPIDQHVCRVVSCCGPHSFIGPGETSLNSHSTNSCDMNLNYSLLFLNNAFEAIVENEKLQSVNINLPLDVKELSMLRGMFSSSSVNNSSVVSLPSHEAAPSDLVENSFGVMVCSSNECYLSPIEVESPSLAGDETARKEITSLASNIELFDRYQRIKYRLRQDVRSKVPPGSPLVYRNPSSNVEEYCIIGIHLGDCSGDGSCCDQQGLTLYGLIKMLEGGPVPCFSLLQNPHVNRLWQKRWDCLILPYLKRDHIISMRETLEILQILIEEHADGTSYLSVDVRTPLDTRISVLKIITALFSHFEAVSSDRLALEMNDEKLYCNIKDRLNSLLKCVENMSTYPQLDGPSKIEMAEVCIQFFCEVLNFKYKGEIEDMIRNNLHFLEVIYSRLCEIPHLDGNFHAHMVILYKKLDENSCGRSKEVREKNIQDQIREKQFCSVISNQQQKYEVLRSDFEEQEKENKKLKKEKERQRKELEKTGDELLFFQEQHERVSQAEDSYKQECEGLQKEKEELNRKFTEENSRLKEENTQLKEENTQLKEDKIKAEVLSQQERKSEEHRPRSTRVGTKKSYAEASMNASGSCKSGMSTTASSSPASFRQKSRSVPSKAANSTNNTVTRSNTADSKTSTKTKKKI